MRFSQECAKLRVLGAFAPYMPDMLYAPTCFACSRAFSSHVPSFFTCLVPSFYYLSSLLLTFIFICALYALIFYMPYVL